MSISSKSLGISLIFFLIAVLPGIPIEILFLKDGEVLIGTIKQTTSKGVVYDTYKGEVEVELGRILRAETSLDKLKSIPVVIQLKDSSLLKGTIVDFDSEIGVFLDIAFGTLTIPLNGIEKIMEMNQAVRYHGRPFHVSLGGGMYYPILKRADDFNPSWIGTTTFQLSIPGVRGLYGGIQATFFGADYTKNTTTEYYFVTICPEVTYKYLDLRLRDGFVSAFTPFASLFLGPGYIHISDSNLYPSSYGDLSLNAGAKLGTEIAFGKQVDLEIACFTSAFFQKETPYTMLGFMIQLGYAF